MSVTFELPPEIERRLRENIADLDQAAKEGELIELYRQDKLSQHELAQALSISRLATEALLKRHRVTEDLPDPGEMAQEVDALRRLLKR